MTDLDTLQITYLAVLVGRIIRDIDLFTVIMPVVPFILESDALVSRDTFFASSRAMVNDLLCRKHSAMTDCPCVTVYKEFRDL